MPCAWNKCGEAPRRLSRVRVIRSLGRPVRSAVVSILDDAREGMDTDIRPQDDLFGHVNGRWLAETEIPSDRSSWGPFVQLADVCEQQVRDIITDLAAGDVESDSARKIADLYNSFMDTERIATLGLGPVRALLDAASALRDVRDLAAFLGEFERVGGYGVFGSYVNTDDRNSDRYLFHVVQGGLGLPDESYYRDDKFAEIREAYVGYLTKLLTLGEARRPRGRGASGSWRSTPSWRRATGSAPRPATCRRPTTSTPATSSRRCARRSTGTPTSPTSAGTSTGEHATIAEVCVRQPSYLEHLSTVLTETPIEAWRDWMYSRVLRSAAPYLPDDFVETNFDFYGRTLSGTPELRARWKRAVSFVEGAVGEAVGKEYVARHFPPESKALMDDLVANLLAAYRVSIEALDWMTEETKQRAYEKLATFRPKIGYPEKFRDYSKLAVDPHDLIGNAQAAAAFETDRHLAKIGSPVDRDEWFMLPQTVNAYYNPGTNEICFPAGILQKPFFSPDALRRPRTTAASVP